VCDGDDNHLRQSVSSAAGAKGVCYRVTVYPFYSSPPFGRCFGANQLLRPTRISVALLRERR